MTETAECIRCGQEVQEVDETGMCEKCRNDELNEERKWRR